MPPTTPSRLNPNPELGPALQALILRAEQALDQRLPPADQNAQTDIVTFGALRFLDAAVANFDALRHAAHRHRIGGIRARLLRGLDKTLRQIGERALIEQVGDGCGG